MKKFVTFIILFFILIFIPAGTSKAQVPEEKDPTLFKQTSNVVQVFNSNDNKIYLTKDDVYLMAQVVSAESEAEPYEGKVAVASVILNRITCSEYPKSVSGVVKQKGAFSCVRNGAINKTPDNACFNAVKDALGGAKPCGNATFFYNPKIATSKWMKNINKKNVKSIGNHVFFVVD